MKKKTLLLVAACALVLTACGTTEDTVSDDQTTEVQSEVESESVSNEISDVNVEDTVGTGITNQEATDNSIGILTVNEVPSDNEANGASAVETFYSAATTLPDVEVENYAMDIKDMILNGDWETFVNEISYPLIVDGLTMEEAGDLTDYIADSKVSADFLTAIETETCVEMFNSAQGITMGEDGQIWLGEVQNDDGGVSLKVVEINNMFEQ